MKFFSDFFGLSQKFTARSVTCGGLDHVGIIPFSMVGSHPPSYWNAMAMAIWKGEHSSSKYHVPPPSRHISITSGACKPCAFFYQEGCSNKVPITLLGTNISRIPRQFWVDEFPFPKVGYVNSLEFCAFFSAFPKSCFSINKKSWKVTVTFKNHPTLKGGFGWIVSWVGPWNLENVHCYTKGRMKQDEAQAKCI